jgi:hypothetical protein
VKYFAIAAVVVLSAIAPGCTCRDSTDETADAGMAAPVATASVAGSKPARPVAIDAIARLDGCTLGHRGVLLDFGDRSMRASRPGSLEPSDDETVEHEGATWLRVRSRSISASFEWLADLPPLPAAAGDAGSNADEGVYVEARVRGLAARSAVVFLGGKQVGTWLLPKDAARVVVARGGPGALVTGTNELIVRFIGGAKAEEPLAETDWVHVGLGPTGEGYAAPTRADALVEANVGSASKRALSLRAPGFVRCAGWVPAAATIETALAMAGGGEGDAEVRILRDRQLPIVLGTMHVTSGVSPSWTPWSVPVGDIAGTGTLAAIELSAVRASKGSRILFGEPRVVASSVPTFASTPPSARNVVLVVLGSTAPKELAPWGGARPSKELAALASAGVTFDANRSTAPLANAVVATMLTGVLARTHGLEDGEARLPKGLTTVMEAVRQAGVATAFFTANPLTGPVFGFDRGWDKMKLRDPLDDKPAVEVFDDAADWITEHKDARFFVVVHARGGHPPWDATPGELKSMPPANYQGVLDAKRAGEVIAKARRFPQRFKDDDRARAFALFVRALDDHDSALGRLVTALRAAGHDGDTTIVVTSDVAPNEAGLVPFAESESLDESLLATPLVVRFAGGALAGKHVAAPTSALDVARTIMDTLGLQAPWNETGA